MQDRINSLSEASKLLERTRLILNDLTAGKINADSAEKVIEFNILEIQDFLEAGRL